MHAGTNICRFPPSSPLFHLMVLWFKRAACLYQDLGLRRTVGERRTTTLLDLHVVLVDVFRTLHQSRSDVEAASPYSRFLGRG
uniref:Putative secreted protein n=1 Tax=Ixodes ricinus TaxID=34613 RepID=A0A6B0U997_IXORI